MTVPSKTCRIRGLAWRFFDGWFFFCRGQRQVLRRLEADVFHRTNQGLVQRWRLSANEEKCSCGSLSVALGTKNDEHTPAAAFRTAVPTSAAVQVLSAALRLPRVARHRLQNPQKHEFFFTVGSPVMFLMVVFPTHHMTLQQLPPAGRLVDRSLRITCQRSTLTASLKTRSLRGRL